MNNYSEILFTLYSLHDAMRNYDKALEVIDLHNAAIKSIHGEKSA